MKKITFIALFIAAFSVISCSGDDDSNSQDNQNSEITGSWELTDFQYAGESTTEFQGQTMNIEYTGEAISFNDFIVEINPDNTYESSGSYTMQLSMNYMGQEITQDFTTDDILGSGTWEVNGDTFSTTDNASGATGEAIIEILSATTLKLIIPNYSATIPGGGGMGGTSSTNLNAEMTLQKI